MVQFIKFLGYTELSKNASNASGAHFHTKRHLPSDKSYGTWLLLTSSQHTGHDKSTSGAVWPK